MSNHSISHKVSIVISSHELGLRPHHPASSTKAPGRKGDASDDHGDHLMQGHMTQRRERVTEMLIWYVN